MGNLSIHDNVAPPPRIVSQQVNQTLPFVHHVLKDNLDLEEKGDLADYLGVNIERKDDHFVFLHLIKSILKDLRQEFRL